MVPQNNALVFVMHRIGASSFHPTDPKNDSAWYFLQQNSPPVTIVLGEPRGADFLTYSVGT